VDTTRYHRSAPYSSVRNLISYCRRMDLPGKDGSKAFFETTRLYADGTVSGKCHRGDTADVMPSRLTQAIEVLKDSFLRRVTALGGTVQEAASDYTCLLRAFPRLMVHTCPLPSLMEGHYHT
jgi:hypothetical protein